MLAASKNGSIDWVAVITPPVDASGEWRFLETAESDPSIDCYLQPVPRDPGWGGRIVPRADSAGCRSVAEDCTRPFQVKAFRSVRPLS